MGRVCVSGSARCLVVLIAWASEALAGQPRPAEPAVVSAQSTTVRTSDSRRAVATRIPRPPVIDGLLDDDVWRMAAQLRDFVQVVPLEGAPPTERTDVHVAFDSTTLYFSFYAHYSDPGQIRANRVDRDKATQDDTISVYLDTFLDQQRAYVFSVNGYGVQGDGLLDTRVTTTGAGGTNRSGAGTSGAAAGGAPPPDLIPVPDPSWDALYVSAGRIVPDGWTAEMAVPFKSLRYASQRAGEVHRWGMQIVRSITSKDERVAWMPLSRGIAGFLTQMGVLEGLNGLSTSRNFEVLPTFTAIQVGSRQAGSRQLRHVDTVEGGINLKYGITSNLTADVTFNPDFSQIELDRPQIAVNQRFPLFFPELRPFFIEGQEIFAATAPVTLIHTRTIVDPRYGGKLTGKVGRTAVGLIVARDEAPGRRDNPADPAFGRSANFLINRVRYDLYAESYVGTVVTDREFVNSYSRVAAADSQLRLGRNGRLNLAAVQAWHRDEAGVARSGQSFGVLYRRTGRHLSFTSGYTTVGPNFRTDAGFVQRVDTRRLNSNGSYRWWPGRRLINWGPRLVYNRTYDSKQVLTDEVAGGGLDFMLAHNITFGGGRQRVLERYRAINFRKWRNSGNVTIDASRRISVAADVNWGDEIRFIALPFLGRSTVTNVSTIVRPWARLQSQLTLNHSRFVDTLAGAQGFDVKIWRALTTYQFSQRLLFRNISEHNTFDRTLTFNALFTYRVNSGTFFFIGYDDRYRAGRDLDPTLFSTSALERTNRAIFTKVSYLFRS